MYPVWKIGRLEDWKIMPPLLAASNFLSQAYPILPATMRNSSAAAWMKKCS